MQDCLFCNIVEGSIPSYKIYEDEKYLAFLDVFPRVKGHTLVVPKKHYRWVYDVPSFGEYWEVAQAVAIQVKKTTDASFISFVTMGEEVPHSHIHILPQQQKGPSGITFSPVLSMTKEEIAKLAQDIKIDSTVT